MKTGHRQLTVLPEKQVRFATRTLRATADPMFNETFDVEASPSQLAGAKLRLKVVDRRDLARRVSHRGELPSITTVLGPFFFSFIQ